MNDDRSYSTILAAAVVCVGLPLSALSASANGETAACPTVWQGYVDIVWKIVESVEADADIVFVNREGKAFDCLGVGIPDKELLRISRLEAALPIDRVAALGDRASAWPANICSIGIGGLGLNYISISLPIEQRILNLESCRRSVSGGLERALRK